MQGLFNTTDQKLFHCGLLQSDANKECRICLSNQVQGLQTLISPCKCSGSLKYVHTDCLKCWIKKMIDNSNNHKEMNNTKAFICCQICKSKILFSASSSLTCRNLGQIKDGFIKSYKLFIALLALLIIKLAFFAALLNYLLFMGLPTLKESNAVLVSLIIAGQAIFSIVAVVTLSAMIKIFLFRNSFRISLVT